MGFLSWCSLLWYNRLYQQLFAELDDIHWVWFGLVSQPPQFVLVFSLCFFLPFAIAFPFSIVCCYEIYDFCIKHFFNRQKFVLRSTKKGGAPNVYRQYTQKNNPSTRKERRNLEKSKTNTIKRLQKIQMRGNLQVQQLFGPLHKGSEKENPQPLVQQFFVFENPSVALSPNTPK